MDGEVSPKPDEPVKKSRIVEILNRFLRWRPTKEELQDRNIIKGNIDTTKSVLERNQTKKKLATLFGQYQKVGGAGNSKEKCRYPQFGIDPTELAKLYPDQPNGIPRMLYHCFAYLEKNLHFEGLFRVTGSHVQITALRQQIENGNYEVIESCLAPQSITGVIGLFFRQLPQPLIPCDLFDGFMEVASLSNDKFSSEKIEGLQMLLERLPSANFRLMVTFLALLKKIALASATNMMNASNLSLVWGPTLLQPADPMYSMVNNNLTKSCALVELMITQYELVFPSAPITLPTASASAYTPNNTPSSYSVPSNTPSSYSTPNNTPLGTPYTSSYSTSPPKREGASPPSSNGPPVSPRPLGPAPTTPLPVPPIVTPSRPPVSHRLTPAVPLSPISTPSSKPPPKPPSVLSSSAPSVPPPPLPSSSPSPSHTVTFPPPPPPLSSSNPPFISSPGGTVRPPPRPPRYNTVTNLHLSPKLPPNEEDPQPLPNFTKADSSPDLVVTATQSDVSTKPMGPPPPPTRRLSPAAPSTTPKISFLAKPPARPPPPPPLPTNRGKRSGT